MREVLQMLEGAPGILGALVLTSDGVLVASVPERDAELHERIAAFVSMLMVSMEKDAAELGLKPVRRITFWAAKGRILILPAESFSLVMLADRETDLGTAFGEIGGVMRALLKSSRIHIDV